MMLDVVSWTSLLARHDSARVRRIVRVGQEDWSGSIGRSTGGELGPSIGSYEKAEIGVVRARRSPSNG
ncbi:hypothetical protein BHE74_00003447 [Ensete ventricosum]|nr:hypothetical protein GW17_00016588 [Ensete ventricosum]RWW87709.1 hypothetical protein BHE74_00003447 [Ensete ventricosum]